MEDFELELSPEDDAFLERVTRKINQSTALGMSLPFDAIYDHVIEAAEYFWEYDFDSTEPCFVGIRKTDVDNAPREGLTSYIQLPQGVQFVTQFIPTNVSMGADISDAFRLSLMDNYYHEHRNILEASTFRLFEVSMYRTIFHKGIRHSYNTYTRKLSLATGALQTNLVLEVQKRLDFASLYNNLHFFRYVVGKCFEGIDNIVSTFDTKLTNGTTINTAKLSDLGTKQIEKVEAIIEKRNTNRGFIYTI